ncbi:MAG: SLBB domain-containing protein [Bacteroidales bacterium]|nr:SLBB domain-containing protein [Bacteroidales bacterium]
MYNYKIFLRFAAAGVILLLLSVVSLQAQETGTGLTNINTEKLTTEQIKILMQKALQSGMTPDQIEALARARGIPQSEIDKIKTQAEIMNAVKSGTGNDGAAQKIIPMQKTNYPEPISKRLNMALKKRSERIFGYSLFTNKELTFDPGINIATPKNYQLGPGDILNIDVWGASQNSYQEIVSPGGKIIIPKIGPVFVSGLTVGQATTKVRNYLSKIYAGLKRGNTFMELSLGGIRSIRVNILGEVTLPGTYDISSLSSVFNAMYAAGGPAPDGSLRDVKIIRGNKTVASLDFYEFLTKGILPGNMRLQDQDIVFVSPYKDRVEIKGQVKRNMFFDMKPGETLKDLIGYAGGFTGKAFTQRIKIIRSTPQEKKILVVNTDEMDTVKLQNGDVIQVDSVLNRYENRVQITGAVMRPGAFSIDSSSTLRALIHHASGLREDAYQNRISVYRLKKDMVRELIPVDLKKLWASDNSFALQKNDSIHIPSVFDIKENSFIEIHGQVARPGAYPYTDNIRLQDLIIQAGGILESASMARINIARRVKDTVAVTNTNQISRTYQFSIKKNGILPDSVKNFKLSPFDQVFVRKSPTYMPQMLVSIEGEVKYPGKYSIQDRNERISDIIQQAGFLTSQAYLKGASLIRKKTSLLLHEKAIETVYKASNSENKKIIASNDKYDVIGIDLEKILSKPGSAADLVVQPGDSIQILRKSQTVTVSGSVYRPNVVPYVEGMTLGQYISSAGGFTKDASRGDVYVVYANGSVKKTSKFLFVRGYPPIGPGAQIIVPMKSRRPGRLPAATAIGLSSSLASLALVIVTLIKTIHP